MLTGVNNQRGNVLLYSLMVAVVVTVFVLAAINYIKNDTQDAIRTLYRQRMAAINHRIIAAVEHEVAWGRTTTSASNAGMFNCLTSNSCAMTWKYFELIGVGGEIILGLDGSGFDLSGAQCAGFNETVASPACPFYVKMKWQPDCVSCVKQAVHIQTEIKITPVLGKSLNVTNFQIDFIRSKIEGTLSSNCQAMGGYLDPDEKSRCILPLAGPQPCPNGQYLNGVDSNGQKICSKIPAVSNQCSNGISTIDLNGNFVCH